MLGVDIVSTPFLLGNDMNFDEFMREVDMRLVDECGLDSECMPDYLYHDAFQNNVSPKECAACALENARDSF